MIIINKNIIKKFLFIIFAILILISCFKKDEDEYKDVYGEIIYTDSFSPIQWENPLSRNKIEEVDVDIGKFIKQDVMDPKLRKILKITENFISYIKSKDMEKVESILTPSAYNSFTLRFPEINFNKSYTIRVAYPEALYKTTEIETEENPEDENPENLQENTNSEENIIWIDFKIIFQTSSIISKLEIDTSNSDEYKISDFENQFFDDLKETFK